MAQETRPQRGSRFYLDAGATLQVIQVEAPQLAAKALYFVVDDLMAVHARAAELGCLSQELVHGKPAGDPAVRPWGDWVPCAWPHDGLQHDKGSGETLKAQYSEQGLNMLSEKATLSSMSGPLT